MQPRFIKRKIALARITDSTTTNNISPRGSAAPRPRQNMINCEIPPPLTAILACEVVPPINVLFTKRNIANAGDLYIPTKPNDHRQMKFHPFAAYQESVCFNYFNLSKEHHPNGALGVANVDRLVRLIQHQDAYIFDHGPLPSAQNHTRIPNSFFLEISLFMFP